MTNAVASILRRAWWVLALFGVTLMLFGMTDVVGGVASDPGITTGLSGLTPEEVQEQDPVGYRLYDFATRGLGVNLAAMGLLVTIIVAIPYRAGERWAWYTMWLLPLWSVAAAARFLATGLAQGQAAPPPTISGPILAVIAIAVLLLDRPRFFAAERQA